MQLRLGVLGADDSLAEITAVAAGYPNIRLQPVVYWDESEIVDLLQPVADTVDMWLFSGQVPYTIAKAWGGIRVPMLYTPHTGAGLWKVLLHLSHERGWRVTELSFDTFHPDELQRLAAEARIAPPEHLFHYSDAVDVDRIADFHFRLWREGKTKAAVTCVRSCQLRLERLDVPAYHVTAARDDIARVLDLALRMHEAAHFRDAQIAAQTMVFTPRGGTSSCPVGPDSSADSRTAEVGRGIEPADAGARWARVRRYACRLAGTVKAAKDGVYTVLTTRGILSAQTADFRICPEAAAALDEPGCDVTAGIGIGRTVAEAEAHARAALQHARQAGPGAWMCVLDDKSVRGPLAKGPGREARCGMTYSYADEGLRAVGAQSALSVATLSRLREVLRRLGTDEITAYELADRLQILPRSARRLLAALEAQGAAEVVGEESPYARGRPRKVYRIRLGIPQSGCSENKDSFPLGRE